jgi:hypothetical protein
MGVFLLPIPLLCATSGFPTTACVPAAKLFVIVVLWTHANFTCVDPCKLHLCGPMQTSLMPVLLCLLHSGLTDEARVRQINSSISLSMPGWQASFAADEEMGKLNVLTG